MKKNASNEPRMTPAALAALAAGQMGNFLAAATPGGIEAQEAEGQRQACRASRLPRKGTEDRSPWEALGFRFLGGDDKLFIDVEFPAGWRLVATDHSMWSDLVDDKGQKRASMFYKAAFYDLSAFIRFGE